MTHLGKISGIIVVAVPSLGAAETLLAGDRILVARHGRSDATVWAIAREALQRVRGADATKPA